MENIQPPFEAYYGEEPYIFISYAHRDAAEVYPEIHRLHESGYRIWYDEGIDPGNEWPEEIAKALDGCTLFISFVSGRSANSINCRNEVNYALNNKKMFLSVYLEDTTLPGGLALRTGDLQAIMKFRMDEDSYRRKMEKALQGYLGAESPALKALSEQAPATPQGQNKRQSSESSKLKILVLALVLVMAILAYVVLSPSSDATKGVATPTISEHSSAVEEAPLSLAGVDLGMTRSELQKRIADQASQDDWSSKPMVLIVAPLSEASVVQKASTTLATGLIQKGLRVVEREQLQRILTEQGLSQSMLADPEVRLRVGKLLSARVMVVVDGEESSTRMRAFDTESSETIYMAQQDGTDLEQKSKDWSQELQAVLKQKYPIQGKIISVDMEMNMAYVNVGKHHGLSPSQQFFILRQGEAIKAGERILGYKKSPVGSANIAMVEDSFAVLNTGSLKLKEGDLCIAR